MIVVGNSAPLDNYFSSLIIKSEANFCQTSFAQNVTQTGLLLGVEHEETATAGTDQLTADSTIFEGKLVPLIDLFIAHATGPFLLHLPVFVHQFAELAQIAGFKR